MSLRIGSVLKPALSAALLACLSACSNSPAARVAGSSAASGGAVPTTTPDGGVGGTATAPSGSGTGSGSGASGSSSGAGSAGSTPVSTTPATPTTPAAATKVGHMWVIMLENEDYAKSFGGTVAPYLAKTLPAQGAILTKFYGTGHNSLDNYISLISGQGANPITQADCELFQDFQGSTATAMAATNYQAVGQGCVYPAGTPNIADQMRKAGVAWKGYMEDMGNDATRGVAATCGHPAINAQDKTQTASATDNYATRHDPFMYFHSVIDDAAYCNSHVVNLKALDADLTSVATTPTYNMIVPGLCHDGHDSTCADGSVGGLTAIDAFLKTVVPKITSSPAFQQDGMLVITFDESGGAQSDASGCCGNASVNTTTPGIVAATDGTSGGGLIGAIVIAPQFVKPGTTSATPYSHYSLLRTWEDLMGLPYAGYANQSGQASFGTDVFTLKMPVLPPKA